MSAESRIRFKKKKYQLHQDVSQSPNASFRSTNTEPSSCVKVTTQVLKALRWPVIKAPGIGLVLASGKEGEGSAVIGQEVGGATA